jgi:class 3 adenylate cyclase
MAAVSLRIVIGMITAVIVLIVASVTLAITYTVSISAVHSNGNQLAEAIVNNVALQVEQYVGMPEKHLFAIQNMSKTYNVVLPPDDPQYASGAWGYRYRSFIQGQSLESNYSYSSIALLWADGSMIVSLDFQYTRGWASENIQTWRNRTLPNGTIQSYAQAENVMYNFKTKQPWNVSERGPMPMTVYPSDSRSAGYKSILQLNNYEEKCVWFPPAVDNNEAGNPRFLLYGVCILYNYTRTLLGTANVGRFLDNVNDYLKMTSKTDNTQLFVVDNYKYLVATTHSTKAMAYYPAGTPITEGCSSSRSVSGGVSEVVGCRVPAKLFPYAPLKDVVAKDPTFVVTAGRRLEYGTLDGESYYYVSQRIPSKLTGYTMNLVLFMPESDILGGIVTGRNIAIGVTVAVFVVAAALSFILVGALLAPIDEVARRMYYTSQLTTEKEQRRLVYMSEQEGEHSSVLADDESQVGAPTEDTLDAPLQRSAMIEIRSLQAAYNTMDTAIKSFTRYVPRDVVKELMATNQMCEIQMRPMRCSMLFTDIANFTTLCEKVPTPVLSSLVRLYFEQSSKIVMKHGGIIDKFIGDCIMVVWGAPVPIDHQEIRSAICARMLVHETHQNPLRKAFSDVGWDLGIRAGVASGEVLAGNMGSQMRMNYTVIGDEVNLASRLEGLNKQWGTNVMISETTAEEVTEFLALRKVIAITVVGKDQPVIVYEVLGVRQDADTERFGAMTSNDASTEAQSVNQVQQEEDFKMMEERYGVKKSKRSKMATDYVPLPNQPKSTGALLARAMRKVPVSDEEIKFARMYEAALQHWTKGDFAGAVEHFRLIETEPGLPTSAFQRLSVQKVLAAAEERLRLRTPVDPAWNGVWASTEK